MVWFRREVWVRDGMRIDLESGGEGWEGGMNGLVRIMKYGGLV